MALVMIGINCWIFDMSRRLIIGNINRRACVNDHDKGTSNKLEVKLNSTSALYLQRVSNKTWPTLLLSAQTANLRKGQGKFQACLSERKYKRLNSNSWMSNSVMTAISRHINPAPSFYCLFMREKNCWNIFEILELKWFSPRRWRVK